MEWNPIKFFLFRPSLVSAATTANNRGKVKMLRLLSGEKWNFFFSIETDNIDMSMRKAIKGWTSINLNFTNKFSLEQNKNGSKFHKNYRNFKKVSSLDILTMPFGCHNFYSCKIFFLFLKFMNIKMKNFFYFLNFLQRMVKWFRWMIYSCIQYGDNIKLMELFKEEFLQKKRSFLFRSEWDEKLSELKCPSKVIWIKILNWVLRKFSLEMYAWAETHLSLIHQICMR